METKNNLVFFLHGSSGQVTFVYNQTIQSSTSPCISVCDVKNLVRLLLFLLPGDLRTGYFCCHLHWNFGLELRVCYSLEAVQDRLLLCLALHFSGYGISLVCFFAGFVRLSPVLQEAKGLCIVGGHNHFRSRCIVNMKYLFLLVLSAHIYH